MGQSVNLDVSEKLKITTRRGDKFELTLTLKDNTKTLTTPFKNKYENTRF